MASLLVERGYIKANLTRQVKYVQAIPDTLTKNVIIQLKARLEKLDPLYDKFTEIQVRILNEVADLDSEEHESEHIQFENSYFALTAQIKERIEQFEGEETAKRLVNQTANNEFQSHGLTDPSSINICNNNVRLPILNLPHFNGSYESFSEFKDSFQALVHGNSSIEPVHKFYYLKSCLSKEAARVIDSIEVTSANYTDAWQLLQERFENKKLTVYSHVRSLFNLPAATKESHVLLRQLLDTVNKHIRALAVLGQPTTQWDTLLIFIVTSKLDQSSLREWQLFKHVDILPTFKELTTFLKTRCELLEAVNSQKSENNQSANSKLTYTVKPKINSYNQSSKSFHTQANANSINYSCYLCNKSHSIYFCHEFLDMTAQNRYFEAKRLNLCLNCLKKGHQTNACNSSRCKYCNKPHNSLLHFNHSSNVNDHTDNRLNSQAHNRPNSQSITHSKSHPNENGQATISRTVDSNGTSTQRQSSANLCQESSQGHTTNLFQESQEYCTQVLLSTSIIQVRDSNGQFHEARAILDSGSQSSFCTKEICDKLQLEPISIKHAVTGIGQSISHIKQKVNLEFRSRIKHYRKSICCLVLPRITNYIPIQSFDKSILKIPTDISLADPDFNISSSIDILIGANVFYELLCQDQIRLGKNMPILQKTQLGWIISGPLNMSSNNSVSFFNQNEINISKFFELEEINQHKGCLYSKEEQECLEHFKETTTRSQDGRFIVKLPLKESISTLGQSQDIAERRLLSVERRLNKDSNLKQDYYDFLDEYLKLKHMEKVTNENFKQTYYLPHHPVIKMESVTTKTRVVFDGSCETDTGVSLNECLKIGPTIQPDLFTIILKFRQHAIVVTADIEKMYRQILIHPDHQDLQRILCIDQNTKEINIFRLLTVTYGLASSPYLAIACLDSLAEEFKNTYPIASQIIQTSFYVDDLLFGAPNKQQVIQIKKDIETILGSANFKLRKWLSNDESILKDILESHNDNSEHILNISSKEIKTLGIMWNSKLDSLQYTIPEASNIQFTKRSIISCISKLFDPMGLLGPVTIKAKIIIQELWKLKFGWDEQIPENLKLIWNAFYSDLHKLSILRINRCILCSNPTHIELHAFSDASILGYGACIYVRSIDQEGKIFINLLCAKSKVAPLKNITLPRMELCAAVLLAQLYHKVKHSLTFTVNQCFFWTDSTIVLQWIRSEPHIFKTFVANRIAEIQLLTTSEDWFHVRGYENPSDLISRGVNPETLINSQLWWQGPEWLTGIQSLWPEQIQLQKLNNLTEQKTVALLTDVEKNDFNDFIFNKYSSFTKLTRVVAYCFRFYDNVRSKIRTSGQLKLNKPLNTQELNNSLNILIKLSQTDSFSQEINFLHKHNFIKGALAKLHPYIDNMGILRVGGRIQNSNFSHYKKHPIVIDAKHKLTILIARTEHINLLHCGAQMLLASLRNRFWPIGGRNLARKIVHNCVICFKVNPRTEQYLMGNLPKERVNAASPFTNTGIDYAGPFMLKDRLTRKPNILKAYVALFICLATKAIHLELVSNLTTEDFLASLRRFSSRRGKPKNIFSDNGTNFIGAHSELARFLTSKYAYIHDILANDQIEWHFIPPKSPNFGGLWEAGVKSTKAHLKRVIGDSLLTFEQYSTILTQIEGVLNSRPLYPLSNDASDFNTLTPAHFLIGKPITSIPEDNFENFNCNRLKYFQVAQQKFQHFWRLWNQNYITELQTRVKWKHEADTLLKLNTMVIIKEDNLPPLKWKIGRITRLYPGPDSITRVVTIKTSNGSEFKRPVSKICVLPIDSV